MFASLATSAFTTARTASGTKALVRGNGSDDDSGTKTPTLKLKGLIKKLFLTKNTDESADIVNGLVSSAVDMCGSFLLEFEESHIKEIASKMVSLKVWDIKAFTNNKALFRETDPMWKAEGEGEQEVFAAAKHLQNFLQKARERFANDARVESNVKERKREKSRGRSGSRKKHRRRGSRTKRSSDSGSSSSSKVRRVAGRELAAAVERSAAATLPWSTSHILKRLRRH